MRKHVLPPLLALAGGGVGFALRRWLLETGFEPDTQLLIPGSPALYALVGFSAFLVLIFLGFSLRQEKTLPRGLAFAAGKGNTLAVTALILGAMLLVVSAGMELLAHSYAGALPVYQEESPLVRISSRVLPILRLGLCVLGLPAGFFWSRALLRGESGQESLSTLAPCALYCVWLISAYQTWSADPVVQNYVYEVLAIAASLLGFYFIAGHSFGNGRPRSTLFFALTGAYFSLVAMADLPAPAVMLRHLFSLLYLTTHALLLLNHPAPEDLPAEENTEAHDHG